LLRLLLIRSFLRKRVLQQLIFLVAFTVLNVSKLRTLSPI
jgi:hypothetical protein